MCFFATTLGLPALVRGDDYRFESSTRFEAYEVNVPSSPVVYVRRRLLQWLSLGYSRALGDPEAPTGRLVGQLSLRLDRDFGTTCLREGECIEAGRVRDPSQFQPIASDGRIDVPEVWLGLTDLPHGIEVRAGRQMAFGFIGMVRFDGITVVARPTAWLRTEVYGGSQVRYASIAGSYGFEPLGSLRLQLPEGLIPGSADFVAPPSRAYLGGVEVETLLPKWARARLSFRESQDGDGLLLRRLGVGMSSQPVGPVHMQLDAVIDLRDGALIDVVGVVGHRARKAHTQVVVEHHEPRFDPGTIWGWFDLVPVTSMRLSSDLLVTRALSVGAELRGRRSDFGTDSAAGSAIERGAGGEVRGSYRLPAGRVGAAGEVQAGDLGPYGAVRAFADHRLGHSAEAHVTATVFHFDDRLRAGYHGLSTHWSAGSSYRISREAAVEARVEHSYNSLVGHRYRGLFVLSLEFWR